MKLSLLAALLCASLGPAQAVDLDALRATLSERMKAPVGAIAPLPNLGLYEAVVNNKVFYTDEKGDIAFFGSMVDLKTRRNLTEQRQQELMRVDFAALPFDHAITHVKGKGTRRIAVFSDPDCPYCQQLEKDLALIEDVTIHTFLLPIPELHPDAPRKAEAIWCSADPAQAWGDYMLRGIEPVPKAEACKAPLALVADTAKRLHIEGTPGIVFADGTLLPGAIDARAIEKKLRAIAASPRATTAH